MDLSSGIGTRENPAPSMGPQDADGDYVDGRGNAKRAELDRHGRTTLEVDEVGRVTVETGNGVTVSEPKCFSSAS